MGVSGSPMSQYLAVAKYALERFNPKLFVFLIINNDFDESFIKRFPGFHYFDKFNGLKLVNYEPSIVKRLARRSAFLRYLYIDLKLIKQLQRIFGSEVTTIDNKEDADKYAIANHDKMMATAKKEVKETVRPTLAQLAAKHISDMWSEAVKKVEGAETDTPAYLTGKGKKEFLEIGRMANKKFLRGIEELSLTSHVIILLDGDRKAIYSGLDKRDKNKPVNTLYDELGISAKNIPNVNVIDLHNVFKREYLLNNERFDFGYDDHWNELGHSIASRTLTDKIRNLSF